MFITMLETRRGSEDGFTVRQYIKGQRYDVRDSLARRFLNRGWAYNSEPFDIEEPAKPSGQFSYCRGTDGCDHTWDICYPDGTFLVSIHFWEAAAVTEAEAQMIVAALNAYTGRAEVNEPRDNGLAA